MFLKQLYFAVLTSFCLLGCSMQPSTDYSNLELVEVTGRVTLNGDPVALVTVIFESEDGSFSSGKTDGSGRYRLEFNSEKSGCMPGKKIVRITTANLSDEDDGDVDEDITASKKATDVLIPANYNTNSELTAYVSPSDTTFDFDLKSEG